MITEFAFKLNGISLENLLHLDEATINEAALNNYIYVYCQDDNTIALGGALNQKLPIVFRDGKAMGLILYRKDGVIHAIPEAKYIHREDIKDKAELDKGSLLLPESKPADLPQAQWRIKANLSTSEFDIFIGDHIFCRGIVFSADNIK